jgi:hypothetical protein
MNNCEKPAEKPARKESIFGNPVGAILKFIRNQIANSNKNSIKKKIKLKTKIKIMNYLLLARHWQMAPGGAVSCHGHYVQVEEKHRKLGDSQYYIITKNIVIPWRHFCLNAHIIYTDIRAVGTQSSRL